MREATAVETPPKRTLGRSHLPLDGAVKGELQHPWHDYAQSGVMWSITEIVGLDLQLSNRLIQRHVRGYQVLFGLVLKLGG
jgi:hypothetical protein